MHAILWNLDNQACWQRLVLLELPYAQTWADTRQGHTDREKRERIREAAINAIESEVSNTTKWAIRIEVWKRGTRAFDIENVAKLIVDSFCMRQIKRDKSPFEQVGLYPDDSVDYVSMLQIAGHRTSVNDKTTIEIFARIPSLGAAI